MQDRLDPKTVAITCVDVVAPTVSPVRCTAAIFARLQGGWAFTRTIKDQASGVLLASVSGRAQFTPISNDVLKYREDGELLDPQGQTSRIHKEYLYRYSAAKDKIEKHFCECENDKFAGLFYALTFQPSAQTLATATGDHLCVKDRYQARYEFNPIPAFTMFSLQYIATGPEKNYVSTTQFTRQDEPSL